MNLKTFIFATAFAVAPLAANAAETLKPSIPDEKSLSALIDELLLMEQKVEDARAKVQSQIGIKLSEDTLRHIGALRDN